MSHKSWDVTLDGRVRTIEARHGYWSARRIVTVDGVEVFRFVPRSFHEQTDLWQTSTEEQFAVDGHRASLRVRPGLLHYDLELIVDGLSADDGLPAGPLRRPAFPPYGWTAVKIFITGIALVVYLFLVIVPFGIFARQSGPRWILASNVFFDLALPAFGLALVVLAWQTRLRGRNVALALVLFALACFAFRGAPIEALDLLLPFDEETIAFLGWEPGPIDLRHVRLLGGPDVEFANNVPIRWRRFPPGTYVLVRGHVSRVILDMRPAAARNP
jgi:hypothetical protein